MLGWLAGCAEPRVPAGGPRDTTPPGLLNSEPPNEAVNFSGESVRLEFTEYVNQASFARAFSITPEPAGQPRFRWRKRRVTIEYGTLFRDSTTYVISLGNDLRDMRGVALKNPITLAFSTGNIIDQGRIRGRVVESRLGLPAAGLDILAYAVRGDSVAGTPSYRTQSSEDGSFALSYLREGQYFVAAVQDRNRDLRPSLGELFAAPPVPAVMATPDTMAAAYRWVVSRLDTIAPQIDRVRSLSSTRLQVRFSEPVVLSQLAPGIWSLVDSLTGRHVTVRALYLTADNARNVYLRTDPLQDRVYGLRPDPAVTDSSGNSVSAAVLHFTSSARADTTITRFTGFLPLDSADALGLAPFEVPQVMFNEALLDMSPTALLTVTDPSGAQRDVRSVTRDGTTYALQFVPPLAEDDTIGVAIRDPAGRGTYTHHFARAGSHALGGLSGGVLPVSVHTIIDLLNPAGQILLSTTADSTGKFIFDGLPEGEYHIRAYIDANSNGRWDGGQVSPYVAPEPVTWLRAPERVRPRWNTTLGDTLRILS